MDVNEGKLCSNPFNITTMNVRLLLVGSLVKDRDDCTSECIRFIRNELSVHNCVSYLIFGIEDSIGPLLEVVTPFIWANIEKVGVLPEFQDLSAEEMLYLIPKTTFSDAEKSQGLPAKLISHIYNWMNFDIEERVDDFIRLSNKFPLSLVDGDVLRSIYKTDATLKYVPACNNIYLKAIESKYFEGRRTLQAQKSRTNQVPGSHPASSVPNETHHADRTSGNYFNISGRNCSQTTCDNSSTGNGSVGVSESQTVGGTLAMPSTSRKHAAEEDEVEFLEVVPIKKIVTAEIDLTDEEPPDPFPELTISAYVPTPKVYFLSGKGRSRKLMRIDLKKVRTETVIDFPYAESSITMMYCDNRIFTTGSVVHSSGRITSQNNRYIDIDTGVWFHVPPLTKPKLMSGWTIANDSLFVTGGVRKGAIGDAVEYFSVLHTNHVGWVAVGKIPQPRADHATAVLGDKIYMVGGLVSGIHGHNLCSSMEAYNIQKNKWSRKRSMPTKRTGLSVAVVDSKLYAIGGGLTLHGGSGTELRTCEVYSPDTDSWSTVAPLLHARQHAGSFVFDGNIYVVGGNNGPATMEMYDPQTNTWTMVEKYQLPSTGNYQSVAFCIE